MSAGPEQPLRPPPKLQPPPASHRLERDPSVEDPSAGAAGSPNGPDASRREDPVSARKSEGAPGEREGPVPDPWALHHDFLKHLTTIALLVTGGIITLIQSDLMSAKPLYAVAFGPPFVSFILTISAQRDLVRKASRGASEVPQTTCWVELAAIAFLGAGIGAGASFFLLELGALPQ